MDFDIIKNPSRKEVKFINNQIIAFNLKNLPTEEKPLFISLNYIIKDQAGNVIAGLLGTKYYWHSAYINSLWVDENYRKQKMGSKLIQEFETDVRAMNCRIIHLDTFDFQAPEFYEKQGYVRYGQL